MKNDHCEVSFYHLSRYHVAKVLPKLLEKIYQADNRCLVLCQNDQEMKDLNDTYKSISSSNAYLLKLDKEYNDERNVLYRKNDTKRYDKLWASRNIYK